MAKQNKQDEMMGSLSFGNISKSESFNKPKKKGDVIVLMLSENLYDRFNAVQYKILFKSGKYKEISTAKSFFRFSILSYKSFLEKKKEYLISTEDFRIQCFRKGKRKVGWRSITKEKTIGRSFGTYHDDTLAIYINIMFSLATLDKHKHFSEYSLLYFFYDILDYLEKHADKIISELKKKS